MKSNQKLLFCCPHPEDNKSQELLKVQTLQATCSPTPQFTCTVCVTSINGGLFVVFTASLLRERKSILLQMSHVHY